MPDDVRRLAIGVTLWLMLCGGIIATVHGQSVSQSSTSSIVVQQCNGMSYKIAPDEVVAKECKMTTGENCLVVVHPTGSTTTCTSTQTNSSSK